MDFRNESKKIDPAKGRFASSYTGDHYTFDKAPKYLFVWSRLFQSVISQAGTFLLTGKFHTQQSAIYKSEGGCNIPGVGELVLVEHSCYFDSYSRDDKMKVVTEKMAALISEIVLNWKPNDPIDSMLHLAAEFIKSTVPDLKAAVEKGGGGGPFGGDALSSFFRWNPFSDPPIDREYEKWFRVNFQGETSEKVDQNHADIDLGRKYRDMMNKLLREKNPNSYHWVMCCSPRRNEKGELRFWINTGRSTQIDGWKSELNIENFLNSDGKLIDTARY